MIDEVYLWIILSLKFTFDIFYFLKSISNKIKKDLWKFRRQILHAKSHFYHCYMIAYIIWINKLKYFCACLVSWDKMVCMVFKIHLMILVPFTNMTFSKNIIHLVYCIIYYKWMSFLYFEFMY
jgi:hypothetical protein